MSYSYRLLLHHDDEEGTFFTVHIMLPWVHVLVIGTSGNKPKVIRPIHAGSEYLIVNRSVFAEQHNSQDTITGSYPIIIQWGTIV